MVAKLTALDFKRLLRLDTVKSYWSYSRILVFFQTIQYYNAQRYKRKYVPRNTQNIATNIDANEPIAELSCKAMLYPVPVARMPNTNTI